MTAQMLLRLALVPAAVWIASLAARRWGHRVSGYLGGLPMIGGPITLFLAIDLGPDFAARSALFTLAAIAGQAAHLLTFAWVGRRARWPLALASGWSAFAATSLAVSRVPLDPLVAVALAAGSLLAAWRWLPREEGATLAATIPPMELRLRLVAAVALAGLILWAAPVFGPVASGILLSMPITGSIMPPFTLALHGYAAVARLLRGFVVGLSGFATFFTTLCLVLGPWGIVPAFAAAFALAPAAAFAVDRLARPRAP